MRDVCELARRVAAGNVKVLLTGESGVGKEVVAHYIHHCSPRAAQAFVPVNCAGLSEHLLETELFGHVKGSFTDAYRDKVGRLQLAHQGTIFLDEIGEMGLRMQALLLRFLESGEIQPVGTEQVGAHADVRLVAATNRQLSDLVERGTFRADLLYRINVVHIEIPPLRERPDDVSALVANLLARGHRSLTFTAAAMAALERYRWPGNVRELQNVIERLTWTSARNVVELEDLPARMREGGSAVPPPEPHRRQLADDLFDGLCNGRLAFWDDVHALFLNRDLTRHDIRELVRRGLAATSGSYRALLTRFGLPDQDYKRLLNFLQAHDCVVDFRAFRVRVSETPADRQAEGAVERESPAGSERWQSEPR
jgi:transcriptional regulator with PAS, ATPase and Fis domain